MTALRSPLRPATESPLRSPFQARAGGGAAGVPINGTPTAFAVSGATPRWLTIAVGTGDVVTARTSKVGVAGPWKTRAFASMSESFVLEDDDLAVEVTRSLGSSSSSTARITNAYVTPAETFDVYVDSVAGNNSNSGASDGLAKQTLSAITVTPGLRIGLKRGSYWRERLVIGANNGVTVRSYGSGARPIIDGSDVISSGSWTKTGGYTNIYQITLAVGAHGDASARPAIWINSARCVVAASLAALDSAPGAIFYGTVASIQNVTPITIYMHSTGSSNPTSDGKTYEAAVRATNIDAIDAQYCNIKGIEGRKTYASYGSVVVGKYCHAMDWLCMDGNSHSSFNREFSISEEITAIGCYDHSATPTMFVGYEGINAAGSWIRFFRCNATNTAYVNCIAYFNHNGGGGSALSYVDYIDCDASNVGSVYSSANTTTMNIYDGSVSACDFPINVIGVNVNMYRTLIRSMRTSAHMGTMSGASTSYLFDGIDAIWDTSGYIRPLGANSTVTLRNSRYQSPNTILAMYSALSGLTFNIFDNVFVPAGRMFENYELGAFTPTINSDRNNFGGSTGVWRIGGVTYSNLAAWRAATGQDANSVA